MIFPVESRQFVGRTNQAYWEGFLTDDEINYILSLPNWANTEHAKIGSGDQGEINHSIRKTRVAWWYPSQENKHIWEKISDVFAQVNRQFFNFDITGMYEPAQLGLYTDKDGGHYRWHTDAGIKDNRVPRKLSMALMLDDPSTFEGGELMVKAVSDEAEVLEQKRGRAWFFPSYTLHTVTPVTKGIRRSLVLWAGGPDFK
jgi:PKHD-type hydroxylase